MKKIIFRIFMFVLIIAILQSPVLAGGKSGSSPTTPAYYSFEDLEQGYKDYRNNIYFDNTNPPPYAYAALPRNNPESSIGAAKVKVKSKSSSLGFPWLDGIWYKGDIIFQRSDGLAGRLIKYISTWTHVSLMWDETQATVLESMKANGVALYDATQSWNKVVAFSVKRVMNKSYSDVKLAAERALDKYEHTPYFPKVAVNTMSLTSYMNKWANKWDKDSMYCSKLVWWVFKDAYNLDLDSNRTSCGYPLAYEVGKIDDGRATYTAWTGVTPDDLYYSKYLSHDIYDSNLGLIQIPFNMINWT